MVLETWQRRRLDVSLVCGLILFGGLAGWLAKIQWRDYRFYREKAEKQHRIRVPLYAHRGSILDREGRVLAVSSEVDSVCADPALVQDKAEVARLLAQTLQVDYVEVLTKLENTQQRFTYIKRKASKEEAAEVSRLKLPGIFLWPEEKRAYPLGSLASHVTGFVDIDNKGCAGIEMLFDKCLAGTPGYQYIYRDGRRRSISAPGLDYKPPQHGYTVVLTIDTVIQQIVEEALDEAVSAHNPKGAVAIAMSPQTGEVLALANRPSFDPNDYSKFDADAQRCRAITDYFEPGSTFKPFVVMMALEQRVVDVDTVFDCHNGAFYAGRRRIRDVHPYGKLTVAEGLTVSSNIMMAQIGMMLGRRGLLSCVEAFNFGQPTGIELPAEENGKVHKRWTEYSITSVPMGQEIGLTPLQLCSAYVAVANGGTLYRPRIVRGVADSTGAKMLKLFPTPCTIRRVASPEVVQKKLIPILKNVVDEGTGTRAKVPGYTVGGKTGTAQKMGPQGPTGKYVSSFVAFAPTTAPKIVVLVLLDEPSNGAIYGGTVAAPAASQIIRRVLKYWRVSPDAPEERAMLQKGSNMG